MNEGNARRILHVDDDPLILEFTNKILSGRGFVVDSREKPGNLQSIDWSCVDLLILDYLLSGMTGLEVCHEVREAGYAGPILMLTCKNLTRTERYQLDAHEVVIMAKPFGPTHLLGRVQELLAE